MLEFLMGFRSSLATHSKRYQFTGSLGGGKYCRLPLFNVLYPLCHSSSSLSEQSESVLHFPGLYVLRCPVSSNGRVALCVIGERLVSH
jgi:hypothetical protein